MAAAVAVISVTDQRYTYVVGNFYIAIGTLAISASPTTYATGGITCSLRTSLIKASRTPVRVVISGASGYVYKYVAGTDSSNGKLKIYVQDAVATNPLLEMADALAIPAGVSGDTIGIQAEFLGQN